MIQHESCVLLFVVEGFRGPFLSVVHAGKACFRNLYTPHHVVFLFPRFGLPWMLFFFSQDLSNLLVEEDKAEEYIADVLSEVELLHKQVL